MSYLAVLDSIILCTFCLLSVVHLTRAFGGGAQSVGGGG